MFEALKAEAVEAAKVRRAAIAKVEADLMLSQQGKIKALGEAEGAYRATIDRLQDRARRELGRKRASVPEALRAARAKQTGAVREVLGREVYFSLLSRWVDRVLPGEMIEMVRDAGDDFERLALIELASLSLHGRHDIEDERARIALADLEAASPFGRDVARLQAEVKALQGAEAEVASLDVEQVRQDTAAKYHLRVEDVPEGVA